MPPKTSPDRTGPAAALTPDALALPTWARVGGVVSAFTVVMVFVAVIARVAS
ncbi:MAG: hypothetical protein R3A52_15230 [Polyangiales bacterium]